MRFRHRNATPALSFLAWGRLPSIKPLYYTKELFLFPLPTVLHFLKEAEARETIQDQLSLNQLLPSSGKLPGMCGTSGGHAQTSIPEGRCSWVFNPLLQGQAQTCCLLLALTTSRRQFVPGQPQGKLKAPCRGEAGSVGPAVARSGGSALALGLRGELHRLGCVSSLAAAWLYRSAAGGSRSSATR